MSRFSSLDAQHAASRDVERQRLERKIGQLRREVEAKENGGDRKFKPPGRRPPGAPRRPTDPPSRPGAKARPPAQPAESLEPGPPAAEGGEGTPSLEVSWLLARQRQMDEDAGEVEAFLLRHDLGRYTSVLAGDPGGQWGSMLDLRLSDEAALVAAGIPAADARRLRAALREEGAGVAAAPGGSHRPPSAGATPEAEGAAEPPRWRRLGRAPPGWRARGWPNAAEASGGVAARVDAAVGGDSDPGEGAEDEDGGLRPASAASGSTAAAWRAAEEAAPLPPRPGASPAASAVGGAASAPPSRPGTGRVPTPSDGSRPGTACSTAGAEKACCYQCYRQVYRARAVCCEGREFCGEACAAAFCQALAQRAAKELELGQLRAKAASRAGTPSGPPPAAASFPTASGAC